MAKTAKKTLPWEKFNLLSIKMVYYIIENNCQDCGLVPPVYNVPLFPSVFCLCGTTSGGHCWAIPGTAVSFCEGSCSGRDKLNIQCCFLWPCFIDWCPFWGMDWHGNVSCVTIAQEDKDMNMHTHTGVDLKYKSIFFYTLKQICYIYQMLFHHHVIHQWQRLY